MENFTFLFSAFAIVWILLFVYVARMNGEQKRLSGEIEKLKNILSKPKDSK